MLVSKNIEYLCAVLAAGSLIVGLGVYDDILGADAPRKFTVQTAAAVILVAFGFRFDFVSLGGAVINFNFGLLASIISVVWIVGVINAMNFIDGMDSLATVVAITIAVAFLVIAILRGDIFSLVIMTALSGSLVGFYRWNKPPAKIFMGDTGSMFIGLLLAAGSIVRPTKSPTALIVGGPMLALALPVLDTLIVMKQRFSGPHGSMLARIAFMFNADKRHIHHILVAKYGSVGKAIASIWLITLLFATAAVMTVVDRLKPAGYRQSKNTLSEAPSPLRPVGKPTYRSPCRHPPRSFPKEILRVNRFTSVQLGGRPLAAARIGETCRSSFRIVEISLARARRPKTGCPRSVRRSLT